MKALVLNDIGKINIQEIEKPVVSGEETIIKVEACGICGSDIPRAYSDGAKSMPLVLGHEFAGIDVDGKRVGVYPLIPCMKCQCCKNRKYELCRDYSYLGSRRNGGFAEYVAVPKWNLIELPAEVSFEQAAMLEPMAVVVHAIRQVAPDLEDNICVMGLGAIGLLLIMFLIEAGYKNIYAIANKSYQRSELIELGLPSKNICNSKMRDAELWLREVTGGEGIDVFFECIGKNESLNIGIEAASPEGKICLVGNPYSQMNISRDTYWKILRNQLTIVGSWNSSFCHDTEDDWHYVITKLASGAIKPEGLISHRFALKDLEKGFMIMRDKSEPYIKIMMSDEAD